MKIIIFLLLPSQIQNILFFPSECKIFAKIEAYETFLQDFNSQIVEPNRTITKKAAEIRAKYKGVKGMDSIHLATSIYFNCDIFLTNDVQFAEIYDTQNTQLKKVSI